MRMNETKQEKTELSSNSLNPAPEALLLSAQVRKGDASLSQRRPPQSISLSAASCGHPSMWLPFVFCQPFPPSLIWKGQSLQSPQ